MAERRQGDVIFVDPAATEPAAQLRRNGLGLLSPPEQVRATGSRGNRPRPTPPRHIDFGVRSKDLRATDPPLERRRPGAS